MIVMFLLEFEIRNTNEIHNRIDNRNDNRLSGRIVSSTLIQLSI